MRYHNDMHVMTAMNVMVFYWPACASVEHVSRPSVAWPCDLESVSKRALNLWITFLLPFWYEGNDGNCGHGFKLTP
jgi:hypothetical protein